MKIYYCLLGNHHWKWDSTMKIVEPTTLTENDTEKIRNCKDCKIQKQKDKGIYIKTLEEKVEDLEKENQEIKAEIILIKTELGMPIVNKNKKDRK